MAWERKSWSATLTGVFDQDFPWFLNWPTSSFFLVSTLTTGVPQAEKLCRSCCMYLNCSLRTSVHAEEEDRLLKFTLREKPRSFKIRPTVLGQMQMPILASSWEMLAVVLCVHRSPVTGSPAVSYSSSFWVWEITCGAPFLPICGQLRLFAPARGQSLHRQAPFFPWLRSFGLNPAGRQP